jgi:sugar phosphate isomerase/epimerase
MVMRIAHNGTCTMNCSVLEDIRIAKLAGFDAIEIIGPKLDKAISLGYSLEFVKRHLDGFPVVALGYILDIERQSPDEYEALIREANSRFAQAHELGADYVEIVTGPLGPGLGQTGGYQGLVGHSIDEVIELTAKNVTALADLAEERNIKLYLEPLAWTPLARLNDSLRMIDVVGRENVGMVIDFWHLWINGTSAAEIAELDPRRIFGVHFCDSLPRPREGEPLLHDLREVWTGGGHIPLQDWIDAIVSTGYGGWWSAEMFAPQFAECNPLQVARLLQENLRIMIDAAFPYGSRPQGRPRA